MATLVGRDGVKPELEQPAWAGEESRPSFSSGLTLVFFFASLLLIFGVFSVGRRVNVDENVFIASAALLSKHFMLYRDFHYNHMPTLVILYALLFQMTGYFLLAARSVSALCAAGAATIIFHVAYESFARVGRRQRLGLSLGMAAVYLLNPLFTHAAGRAWNHDFPIFMSLLGYLAMSRGLAGRNLPLLLLSGILVMLAVTSRLTFATELLPFALFILIYPRLTAPRRIGLLAAFAAGCLFAALPSAWAWAQSPANAYFGNFQYPALNTEWHFLHDNAEHHRYLLLSKIWFYLWNTCIEMPGNGVVFFGFLVLAFQALKWRQAARDDFQCRLLVLTLLAASQLAAALVPSPPFFQYFYAATPFMLLAATLCLAHLPDLATSVPLHRVLLVCLAICLPLGLWEYRDFPSFFWPPDWTPIQAHRIGAEIAAQTGPAEVLTLDPIYVLEGGLDIYPAAATGCFGMRVGDYLTPDQRNRFKMWGAGDIQALFDTNPPQAVMISPGSDSQIEPLFARLAGAHGYHEMDLNKKNPAILLWLPGPPQPARPVLASALK